MNTRRRSSQAPLRLSELTGTNNRMSRSKIPRASASGAIGSSVEPGASTDNNEHLLGIKRSYSNLGMGTPLSRFGGIKRSKSNLGLTTPLSIKPQMKASSCIQKVSTSKKQQFSTTADPRPYQDKKWQQTQFQKIQCFIAKRPNAAHLSGSLRPLQTKTFVEVCNMLLTSIDPKFGVNTANYGEELPAILQIIRYPIAIKKSLLSTVNIPRNWPMAIGIMAWLVDLENGAEEISTNNVPENLLDQNALFKLDTYQDWMSSYKEISEYAKVYENKMANHKFEEEQGHLLAKINLLKSNLESINVELETVLATKNTIENRITKKQELHRKIEKQVEDNENITCCIKETQQKIPLLTMTLNSVKEQWSKVKEVLDNQKISKEERLKLLNDCQEIEDQTNSLKCLIKHLEECRQKEDEQMETLKQEVMSLRNEFNKICITKQGYEKYAVVDLFLLSNEAFKVLSGIETELTDLLASYKDEASRLPENNAKLASEVVAWKASLKEVTCQENEIIPEMESDIAQLNAKLKELQLSYEAETEKLKVITDEISINKLTIKEMSEAEIQFEAHIKEQINEMEEALTRLAEETYSGVNEIDEIIKNHHLLLKKLDEKCANHMVDHL